MQLHLVNQVVDAADAFERCAALNALGFKNLRFVLLDELDDLEGKVVKVVVGDEHPCHGQHYADSEHVVIFNYGPHRDDPEYLVRELEQLLQDDDEEFLILDVTWHYAIGTQRCDPSCVQVWCFLEALDEKMKTQNRTLRILPTGGVGSISCQEETQEALDFLLVA